MHILLQFSQLMFSDQLFIGRSVITTFFCCSLSGHIINSIAQKRRFSTHCIFISVLLPMNNLSFFCHFWAIWCNAKEVKSVDLWSWSSVAGQILRLIVCVCWSHWHPCAMYIQNPSRLSVNVAYGNVFIKMIQNRMIGCILYIVSKWVHRITQMAVNRHLKEYICRHRG